MKYKILVVGLGALGKRHLSSILNSSLPLDIYCYDINPNCLDSFTFEDKFNNKSFCIISDFAEISSEIDFALFSMTSKGRRSVFDLLVNKVKVKNILFEKVLFQKLEDYSHVSSELRRLNIKSWVNCARRQMDSYQALRTELKHAKEMYIDVSGSEWGLACNAIHEIDLIEFLSGCTETNITKLDLLPIIGESKRSGFKEVYGSIYGNCGKCKEFSITCLHDSNSPSVFHISTDEFQYIILEGQNKLIKISTDKYEISDFVMPYQSHMTQYVIEDILLRGTCKLTTYEESSRMHLEFIKPLIEFFENHGMEKGLCPIT